MKGSKLKFDNTIANDSPTTPWVLLELGVGRVFIKYLGLWKNYEFLILHFYFLMYIT